jgi:hypothetical protein
VAAAVPLLALVAGGTAGSSDPWVARPRPRGRPGVGGAPALPRPTVTFLLFKPMFPTAVLPGLDVLHGGHHRRRAFSEAVRAAVRTAGQSPQATQLALGVPARRRRRWSGNSVPIEIARNERVPATRSRWSRNRPRPSRLQRLVAAARLGAWVAQAAPLVVDDVRRGQAQVRARGFKRPLNTLLTFAAAKAVCSALPRATATPSSRSWGLTHQLPAMFAAGAVLLRTSTTSWTGSRSALWTGEGCWPRSGRTASFPPRDLRPADVPGPGRGCLRGARSRSSSPPGAAP